MCFDHCSPQSSSNPRQRTPSPGERRVTPAAELTLLSSGWLTGVALLMMEIDRKVDEEHEGEEQEEI